MDVNTTDLVDTNTKLVLLENSEVRLLVHNIIPASIKKKLYKTYALFTTNKLITRKYDYQCHAYECEAVTYVYILPFIF